MPGNPNVDGQLVISPNTSYVVPGTTNEVPRPSIIMHEMIELVERTGNGKTYTDAHNTAVQQAKTLGTSDPRYTANPGTASSVCTDELKSKKRQ